MKFYLVKFNSYSYDEFDSFVVRAEDEESARKVIEKEHPLDKKWPSVNWEDGIKIEEVELNGEPKIILGSFNAG